MWEASFDPLRFEEAFAYFNQLTPLTREQVALLSEDARRRAFWVSHVAEADVVTDVYEAIRDAIGNGTTFEQFKAEVGGELLARWINDDQVLEPLNRLETIFRSNLQTAYAAGRLEAQTNPAVLQARPFWMYDALIDSRTSGICRNLNGVIRPADDSWWGERYPPNHFNCRSSVRSLTAAEAERRGGVTASPTLQQADTGWRRMPTFDPPELKDYLPELRVAEKVQQPISRALGEKLSEQFDLSQLPPDVQRELTAVLRGVDLLHGNSLATNGKIAYVPANRRYMGGYDPAVDLIKLTEENLEEDLQWAFLHELGHRMDYRGTGWATGYDSLDGADKDTQQLIGLLKNTQSYRSLAQHPNGAFRSWAIDETELYARAYGQYVAVETTNLRAVATMSRILRGEHSQHTVSEIIWTPTEFEPIRREFAKLFRTKGWMK